MKTEPQLGLGKDTPSGDRAQAVMVLDGTSRGTLLLVCILEWEN